MSYKHEPIRDYINFEDYLQKAGYRQYKPKVGSLGKALIDASKHQGRSSFLNRMLDVYFKKLRQQKKNRQKENFNNNVSGKQNSRPNLQSDASNNTKTGGLCSSEGNGCSPIR